MTAHDRGAARTLIDDAARGLAQADIELGDPGADFGHVERLLLDALNLTLQALGLLRGLK
jgi:hypothetical protein